MKRCLIIVVFMHLNMMAISQKPNWQNLDLKDDSVFGISTERAYKGLLKDLHPNKVIVAVIDSGIDTTHEDLKNVLWNNPKDGGHGRSYIAGESGREDITNLAKENKDFYDSLSYTNVPETYRTGYQAYRKISGEFSSHLENMKMFESELELSMNKLKEIVAIIGKKEPVIQDFREYKARDEIEQRIVKLVINVFPFYKNFVELRKEEIEVPLMLASIHLKTGLNIKGKEIYNDGSQESDDISPGGVGIVDHLNFTPYHGTHVAGIIGAIRGNGIGMDGVADHVQIMMLKVISNIRELRDNNLAKAIRFAADNGAKVINLSFGKPYTWNKKAVDEALIYAMSKDIIVIHAAGNAGVDLDYLPHFPNPISLDSIHRTTAWVEVGASGPSDDSTLVASFSNYGKRTVDIFAPGSHIYSTIPGSRYDNYSGTSMAAPVVAGLAALIREYYPRLTAIQVKEILMNSVVKVNHNVTVHDNKNQPHSLPFSDICISGGIANAYNALKLAASYK